MAPSGASAPRLTLIVLALATTAVAIQQTLVLPLLSQLQVTFHTSLASAAWAFTATLLSAAVSTPLAGRFGDLYGKRRILVVCLLCIDLFTGIVHSVHPQSIPHLSSTTDAN
jgi:MFS family permease